MSNYHSKRPPVEGCPIEEKPIPERAWTDAQRYAYLKSKLVAANFYPQDMDLGDGVALIFILPKGSHVSANLDGTIDDLLGATP